MRKAIFLALALALSACAGTASISTTPSTTTNQAVAVAVGDTCVVATGLINIAIVFNDRLSAAQKGQVTHAISILRPICQQPNPPTLAGTALAAFKSASVELVSATSFLKP